VSERIDAAIGSIDTAFEIAKASLEPGETATEIGLAD
jgi:hypothetical protein